MDSLKAHQAGRCQCRRTMNTTGRMARACKVPGTREHGHVAQLARDVETAFMCDAHKAHAAVNPPRPGYACGTAVMTYGGGCFNCGWPGPNAQ